MDSLCNHKEAATKWADGETPKCACDALRPHALHHHQSDHHLVLEGDNLHFDEGPHTSIATGSLQNKIFPPSKEIQTSLRLALRTWTTRNSLPSLQKTHIDELWHRSIQSHYNTLHNHITHKDIVRFKRLFPEAIFHNEDKRATSLRIYCPVLYFSASPPPSPTRWYFENWRTAQMTSSRRPSPRSIINLAKHTPGPLALDETYRMPTSYPSGRNSLGLGDPLSASSLHLSDPC